jgi:hypothetical protein
MSRFGALKTAKGCIGVVRASRRPHPAENRISTIVPSRGFATGSNFQQNQFVDFGFQTVKATDKQDMVKEVFSRVANKYDIMNDLMSMGTHRIWKDEFVSMMGLVSSNSNL